MSANNIHGKDQVEEITHVWERLTREISKTVDVLELYKNTTSKLPSDYLNNVNKIRVAQENQNKAAKEAAETTEKYVAAKKEEERLNKAIIRTQAKLDQSLSATSKEYHRLNEQKKAIDKQNREEARRLVQARGLYDRVQKGINNLTKRYNDLAIRKELNGKLSAKETIELTRLEAKLLKYQGVLGKVDSKIGNYRRNVGNYASGWNGLGNAINQLTREAPAFANSIQTGFMALSNNIPILTDEINRLVLKNKKLQEQGKPTVSVFRQILKSVFSLQTAMSFGITLLVLYGKEIGDWASKLFSASDSASLLSKNINKINTESAKIASQTIPQFKALTMVATDLTKSEKERADAIIKLKQEYPDFNRNILQERDNTELVNKAIDDYIGKLENKAKAQAAMNIIQEKYSQLIVKEQEQEQIRQNILEQVNANRKLNNQELFKTQQEAIDYLNELSAKYEENNKNVPKSMQASNAYKWSLDGLNKTEKERASIQEEINSLMSIYIDNVDLSTTSTKNTNEELRNNEQFAKNSEKAFRKQIATLTNLRENTEAGSAAWHIYNNLIKLSEDSLKALTEQLEKTKEKLGEVSYEVPDFQKNMEVAIDTIEKLRKTTDDFISNAQFDILKSANLTSLQTFFDGTFESLYENADTLEEKFAVTFTAITNVAKEAYSTISQLGQENFNAQYDRLAKEKEVALRFAGESTAAREQVEQQYEDKRAAIQRRQAEAQKEQAKFKIAIDTSQAIVASIAKSPETFGLPFSAFAAAVGALQLGIVSSQKIPQFWAGTEGTPDGTIMVNDDPFGVKGRNYKEVIKEPSGKLHFPQGKNVKMRVPKGSQVYPTYTDFGEELNTVLNSNGIFSLDDNIASSPIFHIQNSGLTASEMDKIIGKHFANLQTNNISLDKNGIHAWSSKGHSKTVRMNNRVTFKGISV